MFASRSFFEKKQPSNNNWGNAASLMGKFSAFVVEWKEAVTPCVLFHCTSTLNNLVHPVNCLQASLSQSDPVTVAPRDATFATKLKTQCCYTRCVVDVQPHNFVP